MPSPTKYAHGCMLWEKFLNCVGSTLSNECCLQKVNEIDQECSNLFIQQTVQVNPFVQEGRVVRT